MIITLKGKRVGTVEDGKIITNFPKLQLLAQYWEAQGGVVFKHPSDVDGVDDTDGMAVISKDDENYLKAMSMVLGDKGYKTSRPMITITP